MSFTKNLGTESIVTQVRANVDLKYDLIGLEIGCFEGRTTIALLDIMTKNSKMICVDPFDDTYLIDDKKPQWDYFSGQKQRFYSNVDSKKEQVIVYQGYSSTVLSTLLNDYEDKIDFIYIDGDHRHEAVYKDAILSFPLLKKNGIIIFDDYLWGKNLSEEFHTYKGIDKFIDEYKDKVSIIDKNSRVIIRKEM
jgi:predicted O-methyltransferase YrrM